MLSAPARASALLVTFVLLAAAAYATAEQTLLIDLPELAAAGAQPETGRFTRVRVRTRPDSGTLAGAMVTVRITSLFSTHVETLGATDGDGTVGWTPRAYGLATISADADILEDPEGKRIPRHLAGQIAVEVALGHQERQTLLHIAIAAVALLVIGAGAFLARRVFRSATPAR